ncbi:MAG TPA: WXG100 family type VII secretion target [Candidatus Dormibacteraeota bacterium]|nr:WXG100 family type VII secretion target [Candidatus Dormibacteraeota bacterium]
MAVGSSGFRADLGQMGQTAQQAQSLVQTMQSQLSRLDAQMMQLWSTWEGQSSTSFQRVYAAWQQDYVRLRQALDGIAQQLTQNQQNYQRADQASVVR